MSAPATVRRIVVAQDALAALLGNDGAALTPAERSAIGHLIDVLENTRQSFMDDEEDGQ